VADGRVVEGGVRRQRRPAAARPAGSRRGPPPGLYGPRTGLATGGLRHLSVVSAAGRPRAWHTAVHNAGDLSTEWLGVVCRRGVAGWSPPRPWARGHRPHHGRSRHRLSVLPATSRPVSVGSRRRAAPREDEGLGRFGGDLEDPIGLPRVDQIVPRRMLASVAPIVCATRVRHRCVTGAPVAVRRFRRLPIVINGVRRTSPGRGIAKPRACRLTTGGGDVCEQG